MLTTKQANFITTLELQAETRREHHSDAKLAFIGPKTSMKIVTSPTRTNNIKGKRLQPASTNQILAPLETMVKHKSIEIRITDESIKYANHPVNKCIRMLNQFIIEAFIKIEPVVEDVVGV